MISSNLVLFAVLIIIPLPYHIVFSSSSSSHAHNHSPHSHHPNLTAKRCSERCASHRSHWHAEPYNLNCSLFPDSSNCLECVPCNNSTCTRSHNVTAAKPSTVYHCPAAPKLDHKCMERCDETRPKGETVQYLLNCSKIYATDEQQMKECRMHCDKCPNWVCNQTNDPNIFYCPHTELEGECKDRCDSKRSSKGTAFQINCMKAYDSDNDRKTCQDDCVHCPNWVCSRNDSNIYNCPIGPPGETPVETSWFIFSLVMGIPGIIFLIVMIWMCVYCSRHGGTVNRENVRQQHGLQVQINQDPYNFIGVFSNERALVTLQPSNTTLNSSRVDISRGDKFGDDKSIDWDDDQVSLDQNKIEHNPNKSKN